MAVANALTYYNVTTIMAVKSFTEQAPGQFFKRSMFHPIVLSTGHFFRPSVAF
jgi:hypothetical protein